MSGKSVLVGIDLGGTNIKVGLVSQQGELLCEGRAPTDVAAGPKQAAERMVGMAGELLAGRGLSAADIIACGIGSPGPLNTRTGCIVKTPNLGGWDGAPLAADVAEGLGCRAFLEGDANAACWGEHWVGAGRGVDDMVMLTLGTGVGGAVIVGGELVRGTDDTGGHIGHVVVEPGGAECGCGNRGCLEAYASATSTARRFREAVGRGEESSLEPREDLTARDVYEAAAAGDELARKILGLTGWYLGIVLGGLANVLNPRLACVSGGMINAGEMLFGPMRESCREHSFPAPGERLRIVPAELGESAGMVGAAGCALGRLGT
ncbi:MAG: ROK family protein [Planctomycetota bacterium]